MTINTKSTYEARQLAGDVLPTPPAPRFVTVRLTRGQAAILRDFAHGSKAHPVTDVQAVLLVALGDK